MSGSPDLVVAAVAWSPDESGPEVDVPQLLLRFGIPSDVTGARCRLDRHHAAVEEPWIFAARPESGGHHANAGDDEDLVAGFLFTERVILRRPTIWTSSRAIVHRRRSRFRQRDELLLKGIPASRELLRRNFVASSSCGLCGKSQSTRFRASFPVEAT